MTFRALAAWLLTTLFLASQGSSYAEQFVVHSGLWSDLQVDEGFTFEAGDLRFSNFASSSSYTEALLVEPLLLDSSLAGFRLTSPDWSRLGASSVNLSYEVEVVTANRGISGLSIDSNGSAWKSNATVARVAATSSLNFQDASFDFYRNRSTNPNTIINTPTDRDTDYTMTGGFGSVSVRGTSGTGNWLTPSQSTYVDFLFDLTDYAPQQPFGQLAVPGVTNGELYLDPVRRVPGTVQESVVQATNVGEANSLLQGHATTAGVGVQYFELGSGDTYEVPISFDRGSSGTKLVSVVNFASNSMKETVVVRGRTVSPDAFFDGLGSTFGRTDSNFIEQQTLTISNRSFDTDITTDADLTITGIELIGSNGLPSSNFSIEGLNVGDRIAPQKALDATVFYSPSTPESHEATLVIYTDQDAPLGTVGDVVYRKSLFGSPSVPQLQASVTQGFQSDLGPVRIGTTKYSSLNVANIGDPGSDLSATVSTIVSPARAPFYVDDDLSIGPLDGGTSTNRSVVFSPAKSGVHSLEVTVTPNGPSTENAKEVVFQGRGVGPKARALNGVEEVAGKEFVDFGDMPPGSTWTRTFLIQNATTDGDLDELTDLSIRNAYLEGEDADAFRITVNPVAGGALAAGSVRQVTIEANATDFSERRATLVVETDEGAGVGGVGASHHYDLISFPEKVIQVQPIFVTDTLQSRGELTDEAASLQLQEQAAKSIWRQAGIDVIFLPHREIISDSYFSIDQTNGANELSKLLDDPNSMKNSLSSVISLWFVDDILGEELDMDGNPVLVDGQPVIFSALGLAGPSGGAISYEALDNSLLGIISHELGHSLGLPHPESLRDEAGNPISLGANNLMTRGDLSNLDELVSSDQFPFIGNGPDGIALLTSDQILSARRFGSELGLLLNAYAVAIPEPSGAGLLAGAIGISALLRRTRREQLHSRNGCGSLVA